VGCGQGKDKTRHGMISNGDSAGECSSEPLTGVGDLSGWGACYLARLQVLLDPAGPGAIKTGFDRLKRSAPRPLRTNFRRQLDHLRWADDLGDAAGWVEGVPASKLADFAGRPAPPTRQ